MNCLEYYIKDYYTDRYISSEEKGHMSPYFSSKGNPDLFDINENFLESQANAIKVLTAAEPDNRIPINGTDGERIRYEGSVLDVSPYKNTLIYYPFYAGLNQAISIEKWDVDGKFRMIHDGKCVGYNENEFVFELMDCLDKNVQSFALIPPQDYHKE